MTRANDTYLLTDAGGNQQLSSLVGLMKAGKAATVVKLPVASIIPKEQVRKTFNDIEDLAASIKSVGLINPIIVSKPNEMGKYTILKGERRWRAYKHLGYEEIIALIDQSIMSVEDETIGELIENIQRDNLTPFEIAEGLEILRESGLTTNEISESIGKNRNFINMHEKLAGAPSYIHQIYNEDVSQDLRTLGILQSINDIDPDLCRDVCEKSLEEKTLTRSKARELLNSLKKSDDDTEDEEGYNETNHTQQQSTPHYQHEGLEAAQYDEYEDEDEGMYNHALPYTGAGATEASNHKEDPNYKEEQQSLPLAHNDSHSTKNDTYSPPNIDTDVTAIADFYTAASASGLVLNEDYKQTSPANLEIEVFFYDNPNELDESDPDESPGESPGESLEDSKLKKGTLVTIAATNDPEYVLVETKEEVTGSLVIKKIKASKVQINKVVIKP